MKIRRLRKYSKGRMASCSGAVMAEACIGMALLVFVWILFTFVGYMSSNQIRTVMAARHAAWSSGHGEDLSGIPGLFFFENDVGLVQVSAGTASTDNSGNVNMAGDSQGWGVQNKDHVVVSVKFGMSADAVRTTDKFPFVLLNTHVPMMTNALLEGFVSVESHSAWPADANNTWQPFFEAMKGVMAMILQDAGTLIKFIGSLFT